jgi:endonuclease III
VAPKWYPCIAVAFPADPQFTTASHLRKPVKQSGGIWKKSQPLRSEIVNRVCGALRRTYGAPRLGNPRDPLDDLVYVILSNKTGPRISVKTYEELRRRYRSWAQLLEAPISEMRSVLRPAGLSAIKSNQLRAALRSIKSRFGSCDLRPLRRLPTRETEEFLVSLPGVSEKVAKCIMMYTLNAEVLPVDVHVHRIARRLGWTTRKRADQCHEELESLVPPKLRYAFHVDCVLHGRKICRPHEPLCRECCVRQSCEYFKQSRGNA